MTFSREMSKLNAISTKIRRAKCMAKQGHPDFKLKHPAECRDAATGNFTMLTKRVTEETQKAQVKTEKFRSKLHDK